MTVKLADWIRTAVTDDPRALRWFDGAGAEERG